MKIAEIIDGLAIALIEKIDLDEDPNAAGDQLFNIKHALQQKLSSDGEGSKSAFDITVEAIKKEGVNFDKDHTNSAEQVVYIYNEIAKLD